jgi:predicted alpha/beta-hydrolase family hydrolase
MSEARISVQVGDEATTAIVYPSEGSTATLVLAHGAGAPQTHPWMVSMSRALVAAGITVVTFNFLYAEKRKGAPDRAPVLEATWLAALEAVRAQGRGQRVFIGGKSMGGRYATMIAARDGVEVEGLVLLGYPLHPPSRPDKPRTAHLPKVRAPMLFVQGSRDPFGTPEELEPVLKPLPRARLLVIEGGDHSLATPKKSGVTLAQTMARVAAEIARFTA